jgi:hypothetical protein
VGEHFRYTCALASARPRDLPRYVQNALTKAKARLAADELRACNLIRQYSFREALIFRHLDYQREMQALKSLAQLVAEASVPHVVAEARPACRRRKSSRCDV